MIKFIKRISWRIGQNLDMVGYYILRFFNVELDTTPIPDGMYCYTIDEKKEAKKDENDWSLYIITCPYRKHVSKNKVGCGYLAVITDDDVFADGCKICGTKRPYN